MTRKEEIINAAYNEAEVERQLKMHPQVFEQGFVAGAKWADAHPDIDVRTMAAWQSGYKEAIEKACEWLEKQKREEAKEVIFRPTAGYSIDIAVLQALKKQRESRGNIVLAFNGVYIPVDGKTADEVVSEYHKWLEKQREQTRAKLGQSEVTKTSDQELSDKIEPKFKPGDYIVFNGLILHIDEVVNGYYRTTSIGDGIHNSYDWDIDNAVRLWTIQEAKDGDVLYLQHEGVEHIIIYKRLVKKNFHTILSVHCAYDGSTKDFFEDVDHYHCITSERDEKEIHPATNEQHDLLFQKMKEAGYKWDSENKELKKIEIKSKNLEPKTLNADKVIEWLKPYSVIEDNIINEFKKDFGL